MGVAASSKTCQLLYARKDHIRRAVTMSYTCCSFCLTIFGLAPSQPLFLDPVIRNPWLTLNLAWPCISWSESLEGPRDISLAERGKSHLDRPCLTACFLTDPKAIFITTQLRSSVWWLLSKSIHISSTCDNLMSKDTTYILCNEKSPSLVLGPFRLISYMSSHN